MKSVKLVEQTATDTLPKLLRSNAQQFGRQIGMREKDRGIWQAYTWRQCYGHVRDFALGLAAAGFKRGDKLSVLGDNRARLYWAQLAAQALGGMSVAHAGRSCPADGCDRRGQETKGGSRAVQDDSWSSRGGRHRARRRGAGERGPVRDRLWCREGGMLQGRED